MNPPLLSSKQAYMAMFNFLEKYYELTRSDDIGALLGGMQILEDGSPMDQALVRDWDEAVKLSIAVVK